MVVRAATTKEVPVEIRPATPDDEDALWRIVEPILRAGETYTLPADMSRADALAYWLAPGNETFVAEADGHILGTYFIRANQKGGGAHVANCGYMTAQDASGRGVARAMCAHSLEHARARGFPGDAVQLRRRHQRARGPPVAELRFRDRGPPAACLSAPRFGHVDAFVMYRML